MFGQRTKKISAIISITVTTVTHTTLKNVKMQMQQLRPPGRRLLIMTKSKSIAKVQVKFACRPNHQTHGRESALDTPICQFNYVLLYALKSSQDLVCHSFAYMILPKSRPAKEPLEVNGTWISMEETLSLDTRQFLGNTLKALRQFSRKASEYEWINNVRRKK